MWALALCALSGGLSTALGKAGNWGLEEVSPASDALAVELSHYYDCVSRHEATVRRSGLATAEALLVLKHEVMELSCFVCPHPLRREEYEARRIVWSHQNLTAKSQWAHVDTKLSVQAKLAKKLSAGKKAPRVEEDELHTLRVRNLSVREDSGWYGCWETKAVDGERDEVTLLRLLFVDIAMDAPFAMLPHSEDFAEKYPDPEVGFPEYGLVARRRWGEWTLCDRCGPGGEQKVTAECWVEAFWGWERVRPASARSLFRLFSQGLPCRSSLLPKPIRANLTTQLTVHKYRHCFVECPEGTFKDRSGPVYHIYNLTDHLPDFLKPVVRRAFQRKPRQNLILGCPTTKLGVAYWEKSWKFTDAEGKETEQKEHLSMTKLTELYRDSDQRLFIDGRNRLHLRDLKTNDSGLYSCWTWDRKLLMTAEVKVVPRTVVPILRAYLIAIMSGVGFVMVILLLGATANSIKVVPKTRLQIQADRKLADAHKKRMEQRQGKPPGGVLA